MNYYNKKESDNDFEIIESPDSNDINNKDLSKKFHDFITLIFKIIFDARNQSSQFFSNAKNKKNEKKDNSFQIEFGELTEYDNSGKKNYFIDFYLNKKDKQNSYSNNTRLNDKNKLFVERWKIKYKDEIKNKNSIKNLDLYLNKKLKIIEKSVVTYSRILPVFNISKQDNISTEFEYCQKVKKKLGTKSSTKKIKLINDNIFSFKLSIKYLKPEFIDKFLKSNNSEIGDNVRKSSFNKASTSHFLLMNEDKGNKSQTNITDFRRLSYDYYTQKYINSKIEENNSDSDCENSDNYDLVIKESDSGHNIKKTENENKNVTNTKKNKNKNISEKNKTNENKKCKKYRNKDNLQNIEIKNNVIKSIVQDYKHLRQIVQIMPNYGNINNKKLTTFISNN